jgi:soluble lytic murein transglycosylase
MQANRPALASIPFDQTAWVGELLQVARMGGASAARDIAARIDDAFVPGAEISDKAYKLRDDYTSLMWLGGTKALWDLGDAAGSAPLFYRYGAAARTPQTRSKGFFWAGHAASRAGNTADANRYYEMAAAYPDRFYGQLALERLGRELPPLSGLPTGAPSEAERRSFVNAPLTSAVAEVARDAPWATGVRFYREIANQATTQGEHLLVAELARQIGRRDLAVILADAAGADGHNEFTVLGYPTLVTPPGTNWTLVHAITRQESQFAQNAISHAGARGLMQLMPGTAREEADKAGMQYMSASLIDDASYNVRLGSNHIDRLLARYGGSYPLAIAAYNAGPGNVNKWLRENGDPRTGSISWIDWIEKIGFYETKNYVQRVLENAVVYESLNPDKAPYGNPRKLGSLLR